MLPTSSNLLSVALNSMSLSSQLQSNRRWPTFEEILQGLHSQGIYLHYEQLAEFLLAHGLPVHLRYVPAHLRLKAVEVNKNYQGDMVRVIEEPEPPDWDYSWMDNIQAPFIQNNSCSQDNPCHQVPQLNEKEQPAWDYSWLK